MKETPQERYRKTQHGKAKMAELNRNWRLANPAKVRARRMRWRRRLRVRVVVLLGGECECCDEREMRFLTIHHRDGEGKKHRARRRGPQQQLQDILRDPDALKHYSVLCWNCHMAITTDGSCPHEDQL